MTQTIKATSANKAEKLRYRLPWVLDTYKAGSLKRMIDREFPLIKVAQAHRNVDAGHKKYNRIIVKAKN